MHSPRVICVGPIRVHLTSRVSKIPFPGDMVGAAYDLDARVGIVSEALATAADGAHVHLVGRVGRDPFADIIISTLHEAGINTTFVRRTINGKTPMSMSVVHPDGRATEIVHPDAACVIQPEDVLAAQGAFLEADTLLLDRNLEEKTTEKAATLAAKYGLTICTMGGVSIGPAKGSVKDAPLMQETL